VHTAALEVTGRIRVRLGVFRVGLDAVRDNTLPLSGEVTVSEVIVKHIFLVDVWICVRIVIHVDIIIIIVGIA